MNQPSFSCGDILFVRGKGLISKAIKSIDGTYSHMAIAVSDKSILEAQRFTKSRIVPNYFEDYDVVNLGLTNKQRMEVLKLSVDLTGSQYDYIQILSYLFEHLFKLDRKHLLNNPNNLICSELIAYILLHLNWFQHVDDVDNIIHATPNEIFDFIQRELNKRKLNK